MHAVVMVSFSCEFVASRLPIYTDSNIAGWADLEWEISEPPDGKVGRQSHLLPPDPTPHAHRGQVPCFPYFKAHPTLADFLTSSLAFGMPCTPMMQR